MTDLNPKRLITEHFDLLEQKRALDRRITANQTKTVELMAKQEHYDLLTVNWARASAAYRNLPDSF